MSTLLIEGGQRLSGRIDVEGNKNSALPLLAACLITSERCVLENVPRIGDVEVMARLLLDLGAEVDGIGTNTLTVRAPEIVKDQPDPSLVGRLRERQEGQTMAEYALILGGIAVVVIAGILILGPAIRDLFSSTGSSVQNFPSS